MKIKLHQQIILSVKNRDRKEVCNNKNNKFYPIYKSKFKINIRKQRP